MQRLVRPVILLILTATLTACGTTYQLPEIGDAQTQQASKMFAEARSEGPRSALSEAAAEQRFRRVAARVSQVGNQACKAATASTKNFNCGVNIAIDRTMSDRNAYFTYDGAQPVIRISMPLLRDSESDDEVAFILSHEYGHLIGKHIEKQQQQALAGALILGVLTAAVNAQTASNGGYYDPNSVSRNMDIGAAAGSMAYSQAYELESDTLGTRITAAAGYDPVEGAKYFARSEKPQTTAGNLSFWGTHPPDAKRLATVLATVEQIKSHVALTLNPTTH